MKHRYDDIWGNILNCKFTYEIDLLLIESTHILKLTDVYGPHCLSKKNRKKQE